MSNNTNDIPHRDWYWIQTIFGSILFVIGIMFVFSGLLGNQPLNLAGGLALLPASLYMLKGLQGLQKDKREIILAFALVSLLGGYSTGVVHEERLLIQGMHVALLLCTIAIISKNGGAIMSVRSALLWISAYFVFLFKSTQEVYFTIALIAFVGSPY